MAKETAFNYLTTNDSREPKLFDGHSKPYSRLGYYLSFTFNTQYTVLSSHDTMKKKPLPGQYTEGEMVRTVTVKGSSFSNGDNKEANRSMNNI